MKNQKEYQDCLDYIEKYWDRMICYRPKDKGLHFGLPKKYVSPNRFIFNNDQFYWDSYFIILGLVESKRIPLAKGMVDNFVSLFKRFGIIPMRNRYYNLGTSQIPFLTSMALEVYSRSKDAVWLKNVMKVAEKELCNYWMGTNRTEKHIVYKGLSRYCDHYITHLGAEHESGWDTTSRFNDRCLNYLPVDLNCCLYKYETDLMEVFRSQKNHRKAKFYKDRSERRKRQITELMWNETSGFFFDYDYTSKTQSRFLSVAGFYPLWAGLASSEQAQVIRDKALPLFENEGGIANTQPNNLSDEVKQHDYPNGWPPQHYIVVKGLLNYGFREDAERIARKWIDMNVKLFRETGKFWEKHNVVTCEVGSYPSERYPTQSGFAWTNAVFLRLIKELQ